MSRLLHLQGIRGVAICSVIAFHYFPDYFPNGYLGVDLFFVLSGYLMSMMLSRHSVLDFPIVGEFLYRRVKRIVPLYYFIIAASTAVIYLCPCTELINNIASSKNAIWLITNIQWNMGTDYFEKMGLSHDLFTHTWSLCLEMQFYLIFPILWWVQIRLSPTKRMIFLHIISGVSLYFYFISSNKAAFNSMFCRVWQFLFGNMVFCLENYDHTTEYSPLINEEPKLEEKSTDMLEKPEFDSLLFCLEEYVEDSPEPEQSSLLDKRNTTVQNEETLDWVFASLSLVLLIYSTVTEQHLTQNYSRMTTTIVSIVLIHFGKGFPVLENVPMVFLGEISYAWYLIHWPMLTIQKIVGHTSTFDLFLGIFLSFAAAAIVHYSIEKPYLGWSKKTIFATVIALLFTCVGIHYGLGRVLVNCKATPGLISDVSTMTIEERKAYNDQLFNYDKYQLMDSRCIFYKEKKSTEHPFEGPCKYENLNPINNKTIAIIGNSWSANASPLIFEECNKYFGNIYRSSHGHCEVQMTGDQGVCSEREKDYFQTVEELKPDYLFIIQRYSYSEWIHSDEDWDKIIKEANSRLDRLAVWVQKKIFVLHTFPFAYLNSTVMNDYLEKGTPIDWTVAPWAKPKTERDMPKAQEKLDEILSKCTKCEQFNYIPQFLINGTLFPYEPKLAIPYVTQGTHFTQPGLEKIRPIYKDICNRIAKE